MLWESTPSLVPVRLSPIQYNGLGKGRDDLLAKSLDRLLDRLWRHSANAVLGTEHIVADEGVLLLDLADNRVGAADQRQAVVDPEIVGLGALPEDPAQLKTLRCARLPGVHAVRPVAVASLGDHLLCRSAK